MIPGLFVTGTNTGVGKTYVASLIARQLSQSGYRVGVYKPVASGCQMVDSTLLAEDASQLWEAAGRPGELAQVCPQRFAAPLAPHLAARAEGREIDASLLLAGLDYWQERSDVVIVEGAGGLMSPLTEELYNADVAAKLGLPLVVVAANELGTISATLQTLITAATFGEGLEIAGVVLNSVTPAGDDVSRPTNGAEIAARAVPPLLAVVEFQGELVAECDWLQLASCAGDRDAQS